MDPLPHTTHKNQLKLIIDLNVSAKAIKLLEENVRINLCALGLGKAFLGMTLKAQLTKKKGKLDFTKIKNFCASKDTIGLPWWHSG